MNLNLLIVFCSCFISSILSMKFDDYYWHFRKTNRIPALRGQEQSNKFPATCCQLEWTEMKQGDKLPKDYVLAGTFLNRDWAYAYDNFPNHGIISDQTRETPLSLFNNSADPFNHESPYMVLTNPNNCILGYYLTRFFMEETPYENGDWHFPRMLFHRYGDFARYNGSIPGYIERPSYFGEEEGDNDGLAVPTSMNTSEVIKPHTYELLYVDCKASLLSLSKAKLYDIEYDTSQVEQLKTKKGDLEYTKKIMVNNSPLPTSSEIKFKIETSDTLEMVESESHSDKFKSNEETYHEWNAELAFKSKLTAFGLAKGGLDISGGYGGRYTKGTEDGNINKNDTTLLIETMKRKTFEFSQKVTVPPFSKTILIAFSKPVQGSIPFTSVYELTPTGNDVDKLKNLRKALRHYGVNEKVRETKNGTLFVYYKGIMSIDAGHEIDVDIQTHKLGTAPDYLFR